MSKHQHQHQAARGPFTRSALRAGLAGLATLLAACASGGAGMGDILQGIGIKKAEPGSRDGFAFTPDNMPAPSAVSVKSMIGSDLDGLLKKHPITNSNRPETWPRVAITVVSAAPSIYKTTSFSGSATVGAQDCVVYNVKVWSSPSRGQSYDGLRLCYGELYSRMQRVPMYQVPTWGRRSYWAGEPNTGSVRNDGPVPPDGHFPNDPAIQTLWLDQYKNTIAFIAGPLHVLGYNWNDVTDKRVWFVSVPGPV